MSKLKSLLAIVAPLLKGAPAVIPLLAMADPRIANLVKGRDLANIKEVVDVAVVLLAAIADGDITVEEVKEFINELGEIKQVKQFVEENKEDVLAYLSQLEEVVRKFASE